MFVLDITKETNINSKNPLPSNQGNPHKLSPAPPPFPTTRSRSYHFSCKKHSCAYESCLPCPLPTSNYVGMFNHGESPLTSFFTKRVPHLLDAYLHHTGKIGVLQTWWW